MDPRDALAIIQIFNANFLERLEALYAEFFRYSREAFDEFMHIDVFAQHREYSSSFELHLVGEKHE